jgi:hypothetical protein
MQMPKSINVHEPVSLILALLQAKRYAKDMAITDRLVAPFASTALKLSAAHSKKLRRALISFADAHALQCSGPRMRPSAADLASTRGLARDTRTDAGPRRRGQPTHRDAAPFGVVGRELGCHWHSRCLLRRW